MSQGSEQSRADLRARIDDLEKRVNGLSAWKDSTRSTVWELEDETDRLRTEIQELHERLDDIEATAEQAMTVASRGHDPGGKSQTRAAKEVTRDELVRRAAKGVAGPARKLTVCEVQDLVDRDYGEEPAWAVVDRAWSQLTDEWSQFEETTKGGDKALRLRADHVTTALIRAVETSLDRDDLAKRFGGTERETGGSE
jgi:regulator of replication initiation timing